MRVLPENVTDGEVVVDFRAYVEWARRNPPVAPAPYPTIGVYAQHYCHVHINDHGEQVHVAVWADVYARGDQDQVVRPQ